MRLSNFTESDIDSLVGYVRSKDLGASLRLPYSILGEKYNPELIERVLKALQARSGVGLLVDFVSSYEERNTPIIFVSILGLNLDLMPLYINSPWYLVRLIAQWRLTLNK